MLGPLRHVGGGSRPSVHGISKPRQDSKDVVDVFVPNAQAVDVVEPQGHSGVACLCNARNDQKVDEVPFMNETAGCRR